MSADSPPLHLIELKTPTATLDIEELAEKMATNLVRTPENAHRSIWRDLVCDRIETSYFPRSIELICDYHRIRTWFPSSIPRFMPEAMPFFQNIDEEPTIFVDSEKCKTIFYSSWQGRAHSSSSQEHGNLGRFFIAAQFGHILLHLPEDDRNYLVSSKNMPELCQREAALFARAILMPPSAVRSEFTKLHAQRSEDIEKQVAYEFGVPIWAAEQRLQDLKLVPVQLPLFDLRSTRPSPAPH